MPDIIHSSPYWSLLQIINPSRDKVSIHLIVAEDESKASIVNTIQQHARSKGKYFGILDVKENFESNGASFFTGRAKVFDDTYRRETPQWFKGEGMYYIEGFTEIVDSFSSDRFEDFSRALCSLDHGDYVNNDVYPLRGVSIFAIVDQAQLNNIIKQTNKLGLTGKLSIVKSLVKFDRHEEDFDVYIDLDSKEEINVKKFRDTIVIYAADIGKVAKTVGGDSNFGWCRFFQGGTETGDDISKLSDLLIQDLQDGKQVALGFECPLFIPVRDEPYGLTNGRDGERDRPWSAAAGSCSLSTGIVEYAWIFKRIFKSVPTSTPTFKVETFLNNPHSMLVWEAFVSNKGTKTEHTADATNAAQAFYDQFPDLRSIISPNGDVISLAAASLLWAGFDSQTLLSEPCLVIKS